MSTGASWVLTVAAAAAAASASAMPRAALLLVLAWLATGCSGAATISPNDPAYARSGAPPPNPDAGYGRIEGDGGSM